MSHSSPLSAHHDRHLAELLELLAIPSVSTDPTKANEMQRAARFLCDKLAAAGFDAQVMPTAGHPAVVARHHQAPGAPTVLIYGHYDVQPPDPLDEWQTPPFSPTLLEGSIVARGASDDKGQLYAHVAAATTLAGEGALPVNVTFLIEGEEEVGSPNLEAFIEAHRDALAADVVVISDSTMVAPDTPTITYGLRGLSYLQVTLRTANRDLHSGAYGGGVSNPIHLLAQMIASLHDDAGRVAVPGFYDQVRAPTAEERAALAAIPFDEQAFYAEIGAQPAAGEAGYTLLERLWTRPTLDVNGIWGGYQGEGAKTVIPAVAGAKISCRLVPDQTPEAIGKALERHLRSQAPDGVQVRTEFLHGGHPAFTPLDAPAIELAGQALEAVYGRETFYARNGGTIPVVSSFQRLLGAEVVLVGFGLESDRIHAPNEKFDLHNYFRGIEASAALLTAFAKLTPAAR